MKKQSRHAPDRMICGKRRKRPTAPGATLRHITVDEAEYLWARRHGWLIADTWTEAISVSVWLDPGRTRELILDLSFKVSAQEPSTSEVRLLKVLASAVRSARAAGWNPESRGRAFRHDIAEDDA